MSINNETKSMFAGMQSVFATAQAESGGAAPWPAQGEHECYLIGLHCDTGTFRQSDGQEFPAATVQFEYELVDDPDRPSPLQWKGAIFNLPSDPSQITLDGSRKRAEIEMSRLKGHLKTVLGREPSNLVSDIEEVVNMIGDQSSALVTKVFCQYREVNGRTYRTEYIRDLLSGRVS